MVTKLKNIFPNVKIATTAVAVSAVFATNALAFDWNFKDKTLVQLAQADIKKKEVVVKKQTNAETSITLVDSSGSKTNIEDFIVKAANGVDPKAYYNANELVAKNLDNLICHKDGKITRGEANLIAKHLGLPNKGNNNFTFYKNNNGETIIGMHNGKSAKYEDFYTCNGKTKSGVVNLVKENKTVDKKNVALVAAVPITLKAASLKYPIGVSKTVVVKKLNKLTDVLESKKVENKVVGSDNATASIVSDNVTEVKYQTEIKKNAIIANYSNLTGAAYVVMLNGAEKPSIVYENKDGSYTVNDVTRIRNGKYEVDSFNQIFSEEDIIKSIFFGNLETTKYQKDVFTLHKQSGHTHKEAIAKALDIGDEEAFFKKVSLENIILPDNESSCYGESDCGQLTKEEFGKANSNFAAYDSTAQFVLGQNSFEPTLGDKFATEAKFANILNKGWGYLAPINHIVQNQSGYQGLNTDNLFEDEINRITIEMCSYDNATVDNVSSCIRRNTKKIIFQNFGGNKK